MPRAIVEGHGQLFSQQFLEPARAVQRREVVESAHVGVADEDLWNAASARARDHDLPSAGIRVNIDFVQIAHAL